MATSILDSTLESRNEFRSIDGKSEPQPIGVQPSAKKKRTPFSILQVSILESFFNKNMHPSLDHMMELSINLNLERKQIKVWFQNRRMKLRREAKHSTTLAVKKSSQRYGKVESGIVNRDLKCFTLGDKTRIAIQQDSPQMWKNPINPPVIHQECQYSLQIPQDTKPPSAEGPDDFGSDYSVSKATQINPFSDFQHIQTLPDYFNQDLNYPSDVAYALLVANIFAKDNQLFTDDHYVADDSSYE